MYAFDPIYGMIPVPTGQPVVPVYCPQPICAVPLAASAYGQTKGMVPPYGLCIKDLTPVTKQDITKAVNTLVWMSKQKKTKRIVGPPKPIESVEKIVERWIKEKKTKRKFWRSANIKKHERCAVREMVRLMLERYPGIRLKPAVGRRWSYFLQGLMQVAQRFNISDRKLRNLTKVALGYRRSHTEDTIDKPKDVYRFYGFDEAKSKDLFFEPMEFQGSVKELPKKRKRARY